MDKPNYLVTVLTFQFSPCKTEQLSECFEFFYNSKIKEMHMTDVVHLYLLYITVNTTASRC